MARARSRSTAAALAAGAAAWPAGAFARRAARVAPPDVLAFLRREGTREVEALRLFPWIAVAYGAGIALAFAADGPLSLWPPLVAGGMAVGGAVAARHRLFWLALLIGVAALFAGYAAAVLRIAMAEAPVLSRIVVGPLEGFVESVEERGEGGRLVVRVERLERLAPAERPARVRVSTKTLDGARPGDWVAFTARLLPPPEAARPGGYDFARDAYFRGIGAVGSVSGKFRIVAEPPVVPDLSLRVSAAIDRARNAMTARIAGAIGGQAGAVAAALVTGKRGLIDEPTNDSLRAAGIYHVVSISGLHMMLAAGVFFWLTRAALALSPAVALRWPIKKIAALAGMTGAAVYCVFSGADVAAERSLLMILVMQGAILFDRPALSMRNLAISALVVLTREPETLLGPSLQMSYAAVAGLIALAEWHRRRPPEDASDLWMRALRWIGAVVAGTILTTLAASVATAPFATFHFQNLQPYGVLGNAVTLPLVSFVVMPAAVVGSVLYPFGLDRPVWWAMGLGVEGMLRLSAWVAGLGGSVVTVPAFGAAALLFLVLALLVGTLCVSRLRWLALVPAAIGIGAMLAGGRADLYAARDGSGVALRGADGRLHVLGKVPAFTLEQWLKADGDPRRATDPTLRAAARCDVLGCTGRLPDGRAVAWVEDRRAFREDCGRAAFVVSRLAAPPGCAAALVMDREHLAAFGASSVTLKAGTFSVESVRDTASPKPWWPRGPGRAPPTQAVAAGPPVPSPDDDAGSPAPDEERP